MTMTKKRLSKVWAALRAAFVLVVVTLSSSAEAQEPAPEPGPVTQEPLDTDGDGVPDAVELFFDMDLENVDTDGDGLSDFQELIEPCDQCDPLLPDTNRDGLCDGEIDIPGVCQAGDGRCADNGDPETRYQLRGSGGCDQSSPASTTSIVLCVAVLTFFLRRRRRTLR